MGDVSAEAAAFIKARVEGLIEGDETEGVITLDEVEALLREEIPRGPANATSFHDVYTLRVAFEHVWREVYGSALGEAAEELFREVVKIKDGFEPPEQITSVAAVRQLLKEARNTLAQFESMAGVPALVLELLPDLHPLVWASLPLDSRLELMELATQSQLPQGEMSEVAQVALMRFDNHAQLLKGLLAQHLDLVDELVKSHETFVSEVEPQLLRATETNLREAVAVIRGALDRERPGEPGEQASRPEAPVIERLATLLQEPHAFTVFAEGSVNYGVLLQYRQQWEPLSYQVGDLVDSLPLAPKESRKYVRSETVNRSRKRKELESALQSTKSDSSLASRAESEVVQRASEKSAFNASATGGGSVGVVNFSGSAGLSGDSAQESRRTKKSFREAVVKAAKEIKNEHRVEIEYADEYELETTTTGEISNPNEEVSVTYLFYELQRRYRVTDRLHDAIPVVLVANEVPNPDEIDDVWLLRHEWILRRHLLDDSFREAFDTLQGSSAASRIELDSLRANVTTRLRAFESTKEELETYTRARRATEAELRTAVEQYADAVAADDAGSAGGVLSDLKGALSPGGIFGDVHSFLFGGSPPKPTETPESAQARQQAVEDALGRIDTAIADTRARMTALGSALEQALDKYLTAVRRRLDIDLAVMKLRVHIKENILYYLQAIWDHEPPDQRFFRLCDLEVLDLGAMNAIVDEVDEEGAQVTPELGGDGVRFTTLKEVADLDDLLGYKGNYMIFRAHDHFGPTAFMLQSYLSENGEVVDPDEDELIEIVGDDDVFEKLVDYLLEIEGEDPAEVRSKVGRSRRSRKDGAGGGVDDEDLGRLIELMQRLRQEVASLRGELAEQADAEEIVVPSNLLFMTPLAADGSLLERYKRMHRGIDMLSAATQLQHASLETTRLGARLLNDDLSDPEVDRVIQFDGSAPNPVVPVDGDATLPES